MNWLTPPNYDEQNNHNCKIKCLKNAGFTSQLRLGKKLFSQLKIFIWGK